MYAKKEFKFFLIVLLIILAVDIETPLLNVGDDFQALVSIAVNPSYFFVQNTLYTHDLETLAQSMKYFFRQYFFFSLNFRFCFFE